MTQPAGSFALEIQHLHGYEFRVRFDKPGIPDLVADELPPLGEGHGPNPSRLLAAAVGSCLSASLLFCLQRAKIEVYDLRTNVSVELERNDRHRLRVGRVGVTLHPVIDDPNGISTCLDTYEDFCVVTQSVREGLDVRVAVEAERPSEALFGDAQGTPARS